MEEAAEAESKKATTGYGHLPELPASLKAPIAQLLTNGAALERGLQTVLDAHEPRDLWVDMEIWKIITSNGRRSWPDCPVSFRAANMPEEKNWRMAWFMSFIMVLKAVARRTDSPPFTSARTRRSPRGLLKCGDDSAKGLEDAATQEHDQARTDRQEQQADHPGYQDVAPRN